MKERIETRISPDLLDTIGRSFKFRHGKGVAEWLKNSLDAYLRASAEQTEHRTGQWPIVLSVMDGGRDRPGPNLAVIDFCGTTFAHLDEFFLYWGDTTAATHGAKLRPEGVTGGHGNGGKFYMREMWKDGARLLTWKSGLASSLVVDKKEPGTTGYWELKNSAVDDWRAALSLAFPPGDGLISPDGLVSKLEELEPELVDELNNRSRGFTVVVGRAATQVLSSNDLVAGRRWHVQRLIDAIRSATQARRPVRELRISVFVNGRLKLPRLTPAAVAADPEWKDVRIPLPGSLIGSDADVIGQVTIKKAAEQLVGKLADHGGFMFLDRLKNPVAWYPITELAVSTSPTSRFLHGEVDLDFEGLDDLIENDRERLIGGERTVRLLGGIARQIDERLQEIDRANREKEKEARLERAAPLNDSLNQHAQRFLQRLQTDIFADFIDDEEGKSGPGSTAEGNLGTSGRGSGGTGEGHGGAGGQQSIEGGSQKFRRPRFPQVLLSDMDADPLNGRGETKSLTKMHPPLYQDDSDRRCNCWWINTSHPFAVTALDIGGPEGRLFRCHQLFMFRDVVQREAMRMLQRREAEMAIDRLETELDEISNKFLGELPMDIVNLFLLD